MSQEGQCLSVRWDRTKGLFGLPWRKPTSSPPGAGPSLEDTGPPPAAQCDRLCAPPSLPPTLRLLSGAGSPGPGEAGRLCQPQTPSPKEASNAHWLLGGHCVPGNKWVGKEQVIVGGVGGVTQCLPPHPCPACPHLRAAAESAPPVPKEDGGKRTTPPTCPPHRFPPLCSWLPLLPPSAPETWGRGCHRLPCLKPALVPGAGNSWGTPFLGICLFWIWPLSCCDGGGALTSPAWDPSFTQPQPLAQPTARCLQGASCPHPHPSRLEAPRKSTRRVRHHHSRRPQSTARSRSFLKKRKEKKHANLETF